MTNPVLVEVTRGDHVESRHRGAIAVVDPTGSVVTSIGDLAEALFPRSAVKPFQALPLVESGAADRYGFGAAELALACASHSGEVRHVATTSAMLASAGRSEADLECGAHAPISEEAARILFKAGKTPGQLHNNCSGKHAGFICTACAIGIDPKGYVAADHPSQREVTAAVADITVTDLGPENRAIDGCSIPTYAVPLGKLAHGFARFITGNGLSPSRSTAAKRLAQACLAEPWFVGGTLRFETVAMALIPNRILVKGGAEGVFCAALPERGIGIALKCDDGSSRAAQAMMAAVIKAYIPMPEPEWDELAGRLVPRVLTRRGVRVGEIRPVAGLVEALRGGKKIQ